jgi:hypothetical protein
MQPFHQRNVRLKSGLNLILEDKDTDIWVKRRPFQLLSVFVISACTYVFRWYTQYFTFKNFSL